jgi:hypothetical protein
MSVGSFVEIIDSQFISFSRKILKVVEFYCRNKDWEHIEHAIVIIGFISILCRGWRPILEEDNKRNPSRATQ